MYEAREQTDILTELQAASKVDASKIEGTFEYDVLASNSIEFAKIEVELEQAYKASFADTSWEDYLTMRTEESGIIRKAAVKAIGTVTFTGTGTIAAGTLVATDAGTQFETTAAATITTSGDAAVEAVTAGAAGNVAAGAITVIPASIPGITAVTNAAATTDGYDEETDSDLLTRYLAHVRTPGVSGNKRHYIEWATSVAGVGAARCIRAWNGPDTVKVIIIDSNYTEASDTLVKKVYDYIESVRPINAILTVVSAVTKTIDISVTVVGTADKAAFKTAVNNYFVDLGKTAFANDTLPYVSVAHIGALLLSAAGVSDYTSSTLKLNGTADNVTIADNEIPKLGTVTING